MSDDPHFSSAEAPFLQLGVECPVPGVSAVRVAGELCGTNGRRLLNLVHELLDTTCAAKDGRRGRVFVDLHDVAVFERSGLDALRHAREHAQLVGVDLLLTGLDERRDLLPRRIDSVLDEFDTAGDLDDILAEV